MADADAVRRQVNLTFALLGSDTPRSAEWVGANVDGYEGRSPDALHLAIKRDVDELRSMWVPIHFANGEVRLNKEHYTLEPVELTEAEASVIGLAVDLTQGANLGALARSGWTKLAASGATRTFDGPPIAAVSNDITRLNPETLRRLLLGVRQSVRLSFNYQRGPGAQTQRRTIDPWGIVPLNNRAYLVGWDVDRAAERVFRVSRIEDVAKIAASDFHAPTGDLQEIVEKQLRGAVVDAEVTMANGTGDELAARGTRNGDVIRLEGAERDWLVRTVASLAADVRAIEPEDVRADVIGLLKRAAGEEER
ncbi:helix-turn-helix transcriptional regulator [Corynebacterium glaucum]|uniref:helix-turn-helix transcriptional regulator n=1 Tax=Corynebacterium glaucum TaxID=187491 RepID=UPI00265845AD|nr:WYL domain-containing protein [Corynebacterium glaucum]